MPEHRPSTPGSGEVAATADDAHAALSVAVRQLSLAIVGAMKHRFDLGLFSSCDERLLMTFGMTPGDMVSAPSSAAKDPSDFLRSRLHALRVEREHFLRVMSVSRSVNRLGDSNL